MTGIILTHDEIHDLTGKKRKSSQVSVLAQMGINFLQRPDGSVVVFRDEINKFLTGGIQHERPKTQPDFSALQ